MNPWSQLLGCAILGFGVGILLTVFTQRKPAPRRRRVTNWWMGHGHVVLQLDDGTNWRWDERRWTGVFTGESAAPEEVAELRELLRSIPIPTGPLPPHRQLKQPS